MQFTIDASATVDVSLSNPFKLVQAARNGDIDQLKDAVTVLDFEYDVQRD